MRQDVQIEIIGSLESSEALEALAEAVAEEGRVDWGAGFSDGSEAARHIIECAGKNESIVLTRSDTNYPFDNVTEVCRKYGLSYRMELGDTGCEFLDTIIAWKPGMDEPFEASVDGHEIRVPLSEISAASVKGLDAVKELVDRYREGVMADMKGGITVAPEVVKAFEEEADAPRP